MPTSQSGSNNALLIQQTKGTLGGASATKAQSNLAGGALAIRQNGDNNDIDILQVQQGTTQFYSRNEIGNARDGVKQTGNHNKLNIDQLGRRDIVGQVVQKGGSATATSNIADIDQTGKVHTVHEVNQTYTGGGSANKVVIAQTGNQNTAGTTGVSQRGFGNQANITQNSGRNTLDELDQNNASSAGGTNVANITQSLISNVIQLVKQTNTGGADNTMTIVQGDGTVFSAATGHNGVGPFLNGATQGVAGVNQSEAVQKGSGNILSYTAEGGNNLFGFLQDGNGNMATGMSTGMGHEIAVRQKGDGNALTFDQQGSDGVAGATMNGDGNQLNIRQDNNGIGSGNTIDVAINGDNNNNWTVSSPALSGDALDARDVVRGVAGMGVSLFGQGDLIQLGSNNDMALNVKGDSNAFGMAQIGSDNTITGTIMNASMNQAVVAQVSSNNSATFSISNGTGNNTGIIQN